LSTLGISGLLKLGFVGAIPALVAVAGGWAGGLFSDRLIL